MRTLFRCDASSATRVFVRYDFDRRQGDTRPRAACKICRLQACRSIRDGLGLAAVPTQEGSLAGVSAALWRSFWTVAWAISLLRHKATQQQTLSATGTNPALYGLAPLQTSRFQTWVAQFGATLSGFRTRFRLGACPTKEGDVTDS